MSGTNADYELRTRWIVARTCVCLGLLAGMVLSWRLWLSGGRRFPVLPCLGLGELPAPFDWTLFVAALGLGVAAVARIWDRWMVAGLVGVLLLLGLLDQMRWQPWAYQYLLCLSPMVFVARSDDRRAVATALDLMRLIVVSIYAWSGVHKFGVQFQRTYRSDVVDGLLESTGGWLHDLILWNGYLVPWMEIFIGVFLLLPRTRLLGIWMAMGTHAFILLTLGPFGSGTNSVIWPWNLAMAGLVLGLFWRLRGFALADLFAFRQMRPLVAFVGLLVLVMPSRSHAKTWHWPQYLSFHLYSGYHQRMALMVANENVAKLDDFLTTRMRPAATPPGREPTHHELPITGWAIWELNVPMPSEDRMLLRVAKILVERMGLSTPDYFYRDYPELLDERGFDIYSPVMIKGMEKFPPFRRRVDEMPVP